MAPRALIMLALGQGLSSPCVLSTRVPAVPFYRGGGWGSERVRGSPRSHSWWAESGGLVPPDPASVSRVVIISTYWEPRGSISIINFRSRLCQAHVRTQ